MPDPNASDRWTELPADRIEDEPWWLVYVPDPSPERIVHGDLEIDGGTRDIRHAGRDIRLTAREFDLLWFLAKHPRQVFSRDHLMDRVWGHLPACDTGTVTVHVRRLREKLEHDPSNPLLIETVWGVGYRLVPAVVT